MQETFDTFIKLLLLNVKYIYVKIVISFVKLKYIPKKNIGKFYFEIFIPSEH